MESKKVIVSRDVTFNESEMLKSHKHEDSNGSSKADGDSKKVELTPVPTEGDDEED